MKFDSRYSDNSDSEYEHESDKDTEQRHMEPFRVRDRDSAGKIRSREITPRGDGCAQNVPNFFMPVQHLEESMRTLQIVTNKQQQQQPDAQQQREKAEVASEMVAKLAAQERFTQPGTKARLPTAEEAKRIAKIFSAKFS